MDKVTKKNNSKHIGSTLESFLKEEGILKEVNRNVRKRIALRKKMIKSNCIKNCKTCKFYIRHSFLTDEILKRDQDDEFYGDCRRYPPVLWVQDVSLEDSDKDYQWRCPTVLESYWCGEWKLK